MKKNLKTTFTSPLARFSVYIILFVAILAFIEVSHILLTVPRSTAIAVSLTIMAIFVLIGGLVVGMRNIFSHVTSFSVMATLATIALVFNLTVMPDPFLLALVLGISYLGAQPFLHRKPVNKLRTIFYSTSVATVAILFSVSFLIAMWWLTKIAQSQSL